LEEQIGEHERTIIKLKRARNSLLNISKLPPEVLGDIFRRNVTLKNDFDGLEKGSRNFLLVCHHWFEVASRTPEVWSFWGNTLTDWARWHRHYGAAPLDLVLGIGDHYHYGGTLDNTICDALRDHAARDAIRRVHLWSQEAALLGSIISPLTSTGEGVRSISVESFILQSHVGSPPVDVSDFLAHYRFPRLQRLELDNCAITSWDLLTSRTAVLTSLTLRFSHPSPTPTTSQLFSILASNPSLCKLSLSRYAVPTDGGGESSHQVPLHYLKELKLAGAPRHVFGLIHQLEHPTNVDLEITLCNYTVADVPRIVGPYLRDYLQRRDRSQMGLGLAVSRLGRLSVLHIGDVGGIELSTLVWMAPFVEIVMELDQEPQGPLEKGVLDLFAYLPRDEVIFLHSLVEPAAIEDMSTQFPNLRALRSVSIPLHTVFPAPNLDGNEGAPTSLQHIRLELPIVDGGGWSPLTTFLTRRASSGNRLESLTIDRPPRLYLDVEERIRSMVQEFRVTWE